VYLSPTIKLPRTSPRRSEENIETSPERSSLKEKGRGREKKTQISPEERWPRFHANLPLRRDDHESTQKSPEENPPNTMNIQPEKKDTSNLDVEAIQMQRGK
jgi:hypothetical protein